MTARIWTVAGLLLLSLCFPLASQGDRPPAACNKAQLAQLLHDGSDKARSEAAREAALQQATRLCPQDPRPYHNLAVLLLRAGIPSQSLEWAQRGLGVLPRDSDLKLDVVAALLSMGQPEQALAALESLPASARVEFYLGMTYRALRKHLAARQALTRAFAMGDRDPYILYALIEQDQALHDTRQGLEDFQTLVGDFPDSPWLHLLLGNAYRTRNDSAHAEEEYEKAANLNARLPIVHFELGRIAFDRADYLKAIKDFRREIEVDPSFGDAYLYLGTSLRRTGKNKEALPYLEEAVARDPNDALAYSDLAATQTEAGESKAALATLEVAERRFPNEPSFPAQLSRLMKSLGNPSGAAEQAVRAEALSRKSNPQLQSGAETSGVPKQRNESGQYKALRACVARADAACASTALGRLSSEDGDAADLNLRAEALNLVKKRREALAAIQQATRIDPNEPAYFITEGHIEQRMGNQAAAIQSFLHAEQLRPSAEPLYDIGMSFFLMGDYYNESAYYQRAAKNFKAALELDQRDDRAEFMLGAVNIIEFKLEDAKRAFEHALQMSPQNPYYHLHYGILLSRLGDQTGALDEMRIAQKLDPSYARTYFNLGEVLEQRGSYKDAKEELETGIRLEPDFAPAYYALGRVDSRLGLRAAAEAALETFERLKSRNHEPDSDPMNTAVTSAESRYKSGEQ